MAEFKKRESANFSLSCIPTYSAFVSFGFIYAKTSYDNIYNVFISEIRWSIVKKKIRCIYEKKNIYIRRIIRKVNSIIHNFSFAYLNMRSSYSIHRYLFLNKL